MLIECKKITFKVYAINREENRFLKDSFLIKLANFVWVFCIVAVIILFSWSDAEFTTKTQTMMQILFSINILMVFLVSVLNYVKKPPQNIYINYEKFLR